MNPRSQVVAAATTASAVRGKGSSSTLQTEWGGPSKTEVGRGRSVATTPDEQVSFSLRKIGGKKMKGGMEGREGGKGIISSNFQFFSKGKKRREGSASEHSGLKKGQTRIGKSDSDS